eukprot:365040-Chlamydomonas_euryale.AAC.10
MQGAASSDGRAGCRQVSLQGAATHPHPKARQRMLVVLVVLLVVVLDIVAGKAMSCTTSGMTNPGGSPVGGNKLLPCKHVQSKMAAKGAEQLTCRCNHCSLPRGASR